MDQTLLPAVYVGKLTNTSSNKAKNYFEILKKFFSQFHNCGFLFIETSDNLQEHEAEVSYKQEFQEQSILNNISSILTEFNFKQSITTNFSKSVHEYVSNLLIPAHKVVSIAMHETDKQKLMELGKKLVTIRKNNFIIIGLGNITHLNKITNDEMKVAIKEFDSWIRVKLWEFDYYAVRDIQTYFPFAQDLFLDNIIYYGPFLVIFGSLIGTDVLYDLYTGFEENNSLRSFYFTSHELVRE